MSLHRFRSCAICLCGMFPALTAPLRLTPGNVHQHAKCTRHHLLVQLLRLQDACRDAATIRFLLDAAGDSAGGAAVHAPRRARNAASAGVFEQQRCQGGVF